MSSIASSSSRDRTVGNASNTEGKSVIGVSSLQRTNDQFAPAYHYQM